MKKKPKKIEWVPIVSAPKGATLKQMSAIAKDAAEFIQMFSETKTWIPARQVLDELREIDRVERNKRKKKQ